MSDYIYQQPEWPHFTWQAERLQELLGRMEGLGFSLQNEAVLQTLTLDALKSSEI